MSIILIILVPVVLLLACAVGLIWVPLPGITDLVNYPSQLLAGDLTPQSAVELLQKQAELGAMAAGLPAWPAD